MDEANFALGGAVAALALIALLGVWLAVRGWALRDAIAPYVGDRPAGWMLAFAWAGYATGTLQAVANAVPQVQMFTPEAQPSFVQFLIGLTTGPLLGFASWVATFAQVGALLVATVVVVRALRPAEA